MWWGEVNVVILSVHHCHQKVDHLILLEQTVIVLVEQLKDSLGVLRGLLIHLFEVRVEVLYLQATVRAQIV